MRPIHRPEPALPVHAMKTYESASPIGSHWQAASCEEVDCEGRRSGWLTMIDESDIDPIATRPGPEDTATHHINKLKAMFDLREAQAYYIRNLSGRKYLEHRDEATGHTVFDFAPGQDCFERHIVKLDREEIFTVRGGDHRGNPTGELKVHTRPEDWVEDFSEHQDRIATRVNRG